MNLSRLKPQPLSWHAIKQVINLGLFLRYARTGLIAWVMTIVFILAGFLYYNFYRTITDAEMIVILRQEVATEKIKTESYTQVLKKISERLASYDTPTLRDLFFSSASAVPTKTETNPDTPPKIQ